MSTAAKPQPWSRGRGFRPKGPFQPARRPGEAANGNGSTGAKENSQSPNYTQSNSHQTSISNQTRNGNQGNSSYVNNRELGGRPNGSTTTQRNHGNMTNGYQSRGNQGNSSGATRDFRYAGKEQQQQGGSSPAANKVQSNNGPNQGANNQDETRLMAKYNYKANPNSPLGEPELALTQGQKLSLIQKHPNNEQWWKVKADNGSQGYVPATYVMVLEKKVTALPWLANSQPKEEELPAVTPVFKPYVSAYNKPAPEEKEEKKPNPNWYCDVCQKQLNGPKPYGAHMTSKAHKEEVELAAEGYPM